MRRVIVLLLSVIVSTQVFSATRFVKASDEHVSFTGRVLHNGDGSVSFDWIGVYMQTAFNGRQVSVRIAETDTAFYNVFIDGSLKQKVKVFGKESHDVLLADNLRKGWHTLRLQRCTEGAYSRTTIEGVNTTWALLTLAAVQPSSVLLGLLTTPTLNVPTLLIRIFCPISK